VSDARKVGCSAAMAVAGCLGHKARAASSNGGPVRCPLRAGSGRSAQVVHDVARLPPDHHAMLAQAGPLGGRGRVVAYGLSAVDGQLDHWASSSGNAWYSTDQATLCRCPMLRGEPHPGGRSPPRRSLASSGPRLRVLDREQLVWEPKSLGSSSRFARRDPCRGVDVPWADPRGCPRMGTLAPTPSRPRWSVAPSAFNGSSFPRNAAGHRGHPGMPCPVSSPLAFCVGRAEPMRRDSCPNGFFARSLTW